MPRHTLRREQRQCSCGVTYEIVVCGKVPGACLACRKRADAQRRLAAQQQKRGNTPLAELQEQRVSRAAGPTVMLSDRGRNAAIHAVAQMIDDGGPRTWFVEGQYDIGRPLGSPEDREQDRALSALEAAYRRSLIDRMDQMTKTHPSLPMPPMPDEATGFTKHFTIGESDGYLHVAEYPPPNGRPGRIQITVARAGDKDRAFMEVAGTTATMLLQRGMPLADVMHVWRGTRFPPSGLTGEGEAGIPTATSPLDYAARFLIKRYGGG